MESEKEKRARVLARKAEIGIEAFRKEQLARFIKEKEELERLKKEKDDKIFESKRLENEKIESERLKNPKLVSLMKKSKINEYWNKYKLGNRTIDDMMNQKLNQKYINFNNLLYQYLKKMLYIPTKCENIVLLSQEQFPTCWFNAPISGFINGVYSSIILKAKLIEYLKDNKVINLNENTCYSFDKNVELLYSFIYTCYTKSNYINNKKEKHDIETFRKELDLQHTTPTTPSGHHGGGGKSYETLDKMTDILKKGLLKIESQYLNISLLSINEENKEIDIKADIIIFKNDDVSFSLDYKIPTKLIKDGEVYHLDHSVLTEKIFNKEKMDGHAFTGYLCGKEFIQTFALIADMTRHNNGIFDWRDLEKMSREWSTSEIRISFGYTYIVYVKKRKDINNNLNNFHLIMDRFKPEFKDLLLKGNKVKINNVNISIEKSKDNYEIKSNVDDGEIFLLNFFSKQIMNLIKDKNNSFGKKSKMITINSEIKYLRSR
jgi:hypothetical protein